MPKIPLIQPESRVVEIVVFEGVQLLDLAGPLQVFATANVLSKAATPLYRVTVTSKRGGAVTASAGLASLTSPLPAVGSPISTLLVTGGPGVDAAAADQDLLSWIRRRARNADRVASVCTGAFLLASAGLLDGRRAVTHWSRCEELARRL